MTPGAYALNIYKGDTYQWRVRLWTDAQQTVPYDLTGAAAAAQIRDKPGGVLAVDLDCLITLPNIVDITLDSDSSALVPLVGAWDLQLTFPGPVVHTPVAGMVKATADVTTATTSVIRRMRSA